MASASFGFRPRPFLQQPPIAATRRTFSTPDLRALAALTRLVNMRAARFCGTLPRVYRPRAFTLLRSRSHVRALSIMARGARRRRRHRRRHHRRRRSPRRDANRRRLQTVRRIDRRLPLGDDLQSDAQWRKGAQHCGWTTTSTPSAVVVTVVVVVIAVAVAVESSKRARFNAALDCCQSARESRRRPLRLNARSNRRQRLRNRIGAAADRQSARSSCGWRSARTPPLWLLLARLGLLSCGARPNVGAAAFCRFDFCSSKRANARIINAFFHRYANQVFCCCFLLRTTPVG